MKSEIVDTPSHVRTAFNLTRSPIQDPFHCDGHKRSSLDSNTSQEVFHSVGKNLTQSRFGQQPLPGVTPGVASNHSYSCVPCAQGFITKSQYMNHLYDAHDVPHFDCDFCGRRFRMRQQMETHRRTHTGEKPYKCSKCDAAYTNAAALNYHKTKVHFSGEQ